MTKVLLDTTAHNVTVSVIIPTYNGAHKILNVLKALEQQSYCDFETLVVIDGSTDNTADVVSNATLNLTSLRIVQQKNKGRAAVRNQGAQEANGSLLIFYDDDMRPTKNCVLAHISHHQQVDDSICVGTAINELGTATSEMQKYKCYVSRKWADELGEFDGKSLPKTRPYLSAANFSLKKSLFLSLGGFDERLNDAEDHELALRAYERDVPIFFRQSAHAWHDENFTITSYIERRKGYFQANETLRKLKPTVYKEPYYQKKSGIKRVVFWFFSFPIWCRAVDHLSAFRFFPKKVRFKLYDLIITSAVMYYPRSL